MQNQNYLLVTTKDGAVIGRLRERDGISDCKLTEKQNDNSTLTFNMLTSSEKYAWLANPENLIAADERVFSAIYDGDSLTEKKDSGNKNTAAFSFVERQCLLDKIRVTAYNSTTTYDHIDEGMVVILSGGISPLTVNGVQLSCPYAHGTAAYALYAVLYGTGWTVGTVDVDGAFDLETDKKSVLENVKAIQSLWGGILMFDSLRKKVHLRSEEIYRPYNGCGVRFRFNETGLERSVNRNIITRLYVYGKDNLNIAASNGGKEYLENYSYTSTPLCGVMVNNDISNAGDLIVWGKRELEKVCKPQVTLKLSLIDRSQLEGGISFKVSDIIDVADEDLSAEKYQARVTEKSYNFFQPWECTVTLGDEKEIFAAKVKYALENADKVNDLLDLFNRISSDDINMYKRNTELNDGNGGWEREGAVYTNVNADGGICLSSSGGRPVAFAAGGKVVARIFPAETEADDEGNETETSEAYFDFRSGTKIYKDRIETGYLEETNPEWFSGIDVSDSAIVFTSGNRTEADGESASAKKYSFDLERGADGRITKITDENGHVTNISRS